MNVPNDNENHCSRLLRGSRSAATVVKSERGTFPSAARFTCLILGLLALFCQLARAQETCPTSPSNASGKSFEGQELRSKNFSHQDLTNANFRNATLTASVFIHANLTGADFSGATFNGGQLPSDFSFANLDRACFIGAKFNGNTYFTYATLTCADFSKTDILTGNHAIFGELLEFDSAQCRPAFRSTKMNCEFVDQWKDLDLTDATIQACHEHLEGRDFSNALMSEVVFSGVNLNDTKWNGAHLRGSFFIRAYLEKAEFDGADLRQAHLTQAHAKGAKLRSQARLSGAFLSGIELIGADLTSAVLAAADGLQPADLTFAYMPNAVLTDAQMTGVNLSHAEFYGAGGKADKATMHQVNFANANLGGVNLAQGHLVGARFDGAVLVNANLRGAFLHTTSTSIPASLARANLQGADLTDAKLQGANLSNAAVALDQGVPLFGLETDLTGDLNERWLTAEVADGFADKGYTLLTCSDPAVHVLTLKKTWEIWLEKPVGEGGKQPYKRFLVSSQTGGVAVSGIDADAESDTRELFTVPGDFSGELDGKNLPRAILQAFRNNDYPLPPCKNPVISVTEAGAKWKLVETLRSVTSAGLGYTGYSLVTGTGKVGVYGSQITVVRPDEHGRLTLVPVAVRKTGISASSFDDTTTMPNQESYGANKKEGATWEQMMTAATPPAPPRCIPSPYQWCPPVNSDESSPIPPTGLAKGSTESTDLENER